MCYYSGEAAFSVAISDICYVGLTQPSLSQSKGVIVEDSRLMSLNLIILMAFYLTLLLD